MIGYLGNMNWICARSCQSATRVGSHHDVVGGELAVHRQLAKMEDLAYAAAHRKRELLVRRGQPVHGDDRRDTAIDAFLS
jgi:hypothetical protein